MNKQQAKARAAMNEPDLMVFGVIVSFRGTTIQLTHEGSEREWWIASALADDGEHGTWVDGEAETIKAACLACALAVEAIERPLEVDNCDDDRSDDDGGW